MQTVNRYAYLVLYYQFPFTVLYTLRSSYCKWRHLFLRCVQCVVYLMRRYGWSYSWPRRWIHIHFSKSAFAFCGSRFSLPFLGTVFTHLFLLSCPSLSPLLPLSFSFSSLYLSLRPFFTWWCDLSANMATAKRAILNLIWPLTHSKCQQQHLHHHLYLCCCCCCCYEYCTPCCYCHFECSITFQLLLLPLLGPLDETRHDNCRLPTLPCPPPPSPPASVIRKSNFCATISTLLFCKFNENANEQSERNKKRKSINCVCRQVISSPFRSETCVNDIWLLRWLLDLHDCDSCEGGHFNSLRVTH